MRTAASVALTLVALLLAAGSARAGTWMQVSCVNPNGSAAPSEGWTQSAAGPVDGGGVASTQCSPSAPMVAALSVLSPAPAGSTELLTYQPPVGSALVGGSVDVNMTADGTGSDANGGGAVTRAELFEPVVSSSPFFQCVAGFNICSASAPDFSGLVNLPDDAQGDLIATVTCQANDGTAPCNANPKNNVWAQVQVLWARLLLSSSENIAHSDESGDVLAGKVRGTGHLIFTASEPAGPGIYLVSVAIDGQTVSTTVPNTNGGKCVPVGTDPATGALIFDYQQPCLTTEVVDAAVPTAGLPDGTHNVTISAADASGSSAPVFDDTVTTSNPQTTPNPTGRRALHARFVLSWRWSGATTLLRSIRVNHLLRGAKVAVRCSGKHCPRITAHATGARRVAKLLRTLGGRRLRAGQTLLITVTARRHTAERIAVTIRNGLKPSARLLR
jgi:hypothetical protein